jgi:hypothetical protein
MNKVHRPHRVSGYIAKVDYQQTTDKDGQPDWVMLYMPGPKAGTEYRAFTNRGGPSVLELEVEPPDATPLLTVMESSPLVRDLIERGVTAAKAEELARSHGEEKIAAQIERLDWLLEKKPEKISDPAAYLVGAIIDDYAAPKGFVSKAERMRRAEAKAAKERQAAEEHRRKQAEVEQERAEQAAIQAYWASLTQQQQAELDEAAAAGVKPEMLALENGPLREMGRRIRRNEYIHNLLKHREATLLPA